MKISFNLGIADLTAFNRYYYHNDPAVRRDLLRACLIVSVLIVVYGLFHSFKHGRYNWVALTLSVALGLLFFFLLLFYYRRQWMARVRREIGMPENALLLGKREMEFDDEKVHIVHDHGEETVLWSGLLKAAEIPSHFFLFNTPKQALCIPKEGMGQAEVEELRSLLARHIAVTTLEQENKK